MNSSTITTSTGLLTTAEALDRAYRGQQCEVVRPDGTAKPVRVQRWVRRASSTDLRLFVDQCSGPTLDVGCGPGRLTAALRREGVPALGIDISREAVRQTRLRGGAALCCDVFDDTVPDWGWAHVVLADGNIGLGGDPQRLLRRVAQLLAADGAVHVELAAGSSSVHPSLRLRVGERLSPPFGWATVGLDVIEEMAQAAGLTVSHLRRASERTVATLRHMHPGA